MLKFQRRLRVVSQQDEPAPKSFMFTCMAVLFCAVLFHPLSFRLGCFVVGIYPTSRQQLRVSLLCSYPSRLLPPVSRDLVLSDRTHTVGWFVTVSEDYPVGPVASPPSLPLPSSPPRTDVILDQKCRFLLLSLCL